jgi:hypothetical protein
MFLDLCPPAFIYLIFSLIQICVDSFNGLLQTAFIKLLVMIVVTFLLNTLCGSGLSIISWIIVLAPFIFMLVSASILLYVFGTNIQTPPMPPTPPPKPPTPPPKPPTPPPKPRFPIFPIHPPIPPTPPPRPPDSGCSVETTRNWGVYNGNVILLPSQTTETIC